MQVVLTPELERLAQQLATEGEYPSIQEVIRDGLMLLRDQQDEDQKHLRQLRDALAVGITQADQGKVGPLDPKGTLDRVRARRDGARKGK
jgi:antitoxin ParD1/3/4